MDREGIAERHDVRVLADEVHAPLTVAGPVADDVARLPFEVEAGTGLLGVVAARSAFADGEPWLDGLLAALDRNRRRLASLLADAAPKVDYRMPDGTYLAWLDCTDLGLDGDPAAVFLHRGRVALNSGPTFGAPGTGHARLNFATSPTLLAEAVRRMAAAVDA